MKVETIPHSLRVTSCPTPREDIPLSDNRSGFRLGNENTGRRLCRSSIRLCLGMVLLVVLVAAVSSLFYSRPLQISKQTTYVTGPLTPDGKGIDYVAVIEHAIGAGFIATDKNGYRLLVQRLGKWPDSDSVHFPTICQKLGLDADALRPDVTFEDQWDFLKGYVASDQFHEALLEELPHPDRSTLGIAGMFDARLGRPWTLDDLPMMAEWLDANSPALDVIGRAVRKPVFQSPLVGGRTTHTARLRMAQSVGSLAEGIRE
jgi:hypothetical protein